MAEQLDGGNAGILVPPRKPKQIAAAICELLENPSRRKELGRKARARVLATYNAERVGEMMEQSYHRAIERARSRMQTAVAA
jgi:glycosyltransferase involved in cell wall biosynthesis